LAKTSGPDVICIAATRGIAGYYGGARGRPQWCLISGPHDVELVDAIEPLDLQPDGQSHLGLELAEGGRLGLEQTLDHVGVREDQQLAAGYARALPQDLAEDLVAHGLRRLHEPPPLARAAGLAEQMLQALARALAGHLDQPE